MDRYRKLLESQILPARTRAEAIEAIKQLVNQRFLTVAEGGDLLDRWAEKPDQPEQADFFRAGDAHGKEVPSRPSSAKRPEPPTENRLLIVMIGMFYAKLEKLRANPVVRTEDAVLRLDLKNKIAVLREYMQGNEAAKKGFRKLISSADTQDAERHINDEMPLEAFGRWCDERAREAVVDSAPERSAS